MSEKANELDALLSEEQYNEFVESQHDEEMVEEAEGTKSHKKDQ